MWFQVLACDYDGTLATAGKIAPATARALERVRATGRRVVLVTGRRLDDLLDVCPEVDLFDLVVAENGAVLLAPGTGEIEDLAAPPQPSLLARLEAKGVPFSVGRVIVATVDPHGSKVRDAIRELGLELDVILNREAVMVLPRGVSKESGLERALDRLAISPHNAVAVGDAENDEAFLRRAGLAVAVANAVPSLAAQADIVTTAPDGAGVRELIDAWILPDFEPLRRRLLHRTITLGRRPDGEPLDYPVLGPPLLVTGATRGAATPLVERLVAQLVDEDYVVWLLEARDDDRPGIAQRLGIRALGAAELELARFERFGQAERSDGAGRALLPSQRPASLVLDVTPLARRQRLDASRRFLRAVVRQRAESGAPHWVVIDEAQEVFAARRKATNPPSGFDWTGVCLVSSQPGLLARAVRMKARHVLSTSIETLVEGMPVSRSEIPVKRLKSGEALSVDLDVAAGGRVRCFRVASPRVHSRL
jgi:hydroxymethylpyrimidine pyrophosphatase-like HAD family hydrolase